MKNELRVKKFINGVAFCVLVISGIALVVSLILGKLEVAQNFANILRQISYCLAFIVVSVSAYSYVRTKRSAGWLIVYINCVLFVVVPLIVGLFSL